MNVWLARLPVYEPMIHAALAEKNLPRDLVYLALIESGYSNSAVSRSKAVGMWQFMRPTARRFNLRVDSHVDERYDWQSSTDAAIAYLKVLHDHFDGSWPLAFELMRRCQLAATPGRDFAQAEPGRYLRFSTANSMAQLQEAVARLEAAW